MKRKLAILLLCLTLILIFSPLSVYAKDYTGEDTLSSENIVVYNVDMGISVYRKNHQEKVSPGNSVKIMTALLALEYFEGRLDTIVTVPYAATRGLKVPVLSLKENEEISVLDLIHATLVAGMNDAANTLALVIGGNMKNFVNLMNEKAKELGAFDTLYLDATGLSASDYTTAYDTARIAAYAYENELFMEICSKTVYTVSETNFHPQTKIFTLNELLISSKKAYYRYAEGMSVDYSDENGAQLVCAASHGNYAYVCVAFGSKKDASGTIGGYSDIKNLLSWSSGNFAERKILDTSQIICELPVRAGKDVAHVLVVPYKSVYAFFDKDTDLSNITLVENLYYDRLDAPVQKGDCVGFVTIILDGVPIGTTLLIAKSNVRQSTFGGLMLKVEKTITTPFFIISSIISFLSTLVSILIKRKKKIQKN